jgi:hypothetical protein
MKAEIELFPFSSPVRKGGVIGYLKISTSSLNPYELFNQQSGYFCDS